MFMDFIQYIDRKEQLPVKERFIHIHNKLSKEDLLQAFKDEFEFPDYFGMNWDALYDCLLNAYWLEDKEVFLFHDNLLPKLSRQDFKAYLQILNDVLANAAEYKLRVVFLKKDRDQISSLLIS